MHLNRRDFLTTATAGALLGLADPADAAAPPRAKSPFLEGNYAPVRAELTAGNLKVIGKLPAELDGLFVRNGPNPQFPPRNAYHWFDGDGMLHGVRIKDGKASYRNRYVRTQGWREERKAGKALYDGLLGLPDFKKIARGKEGFKNTANTALVWYNGKLLALWEGGAPHAIGVPDLDTIGRFTFGGKLRHACTAHPKIDSATGEMMFFGYQPFRPYVRYSVANAKGAIVRTTPIDIPRPVMMHDFAITRKYTIFMDLPGIFDFRRALRRQPPFRFEPKFGARFGVLPRHAKGGAIKWFTSPPCYVFHTLNAHDEGDEVVLLACRMKEFPSVIEPPDRPIGRARKERSAVLYRWRFNMKTGKVREEAVDDVPSDFPRVDDARLGCKTRFGYTMRLKMDALIKYDLEKGKSATHSFGKGRLGGEAVFVPRPGGKAEDDGWLVTYVYDRASNKSEMIVIDGQDFTARPVARVLLPARVPYGFHGTWLPGKVLAGKAKG
jgi:carotenoid cleavage dioxygenase